MQPNTQALVRIEPYQRREMSLDEMMSLSEIFIKSGFFADCKSQYQAVVKILAGVELGLEPFAALSELHVIQGKIVMSAGLLAKKVKQSGKYDYRVKEQSDKVCVVEFFQNAEKIGTSTFTLDDAKKAQVKNLDKFPRNMLFARAMSNGVRWYCPDVTGNTVVYAEGEIETDEAEAVTQEPEKKRSKKAAPVVTVEASGETTVIPVPENPPERHPKLIFWDACKEASVGKDQAAAIWKEAEEKLDYAMAILSQLTVPPSDDFLDGVAEPITEQQAAMEAQAPSILPLTRSAKDLRNDPVGFDSSAVWKWIKFNQLDATEPNAQRIYKIIEVNSSEVTKRGATKPERVTNWEAVVYQIKFEFSR